jgi:hypothetical protein
MKEKLELYLKENLETHIGFKKARYVLEDSCLGRATLEDLDYETSANIDEYIDKNKDDNKFQKLLFKYIDERNLKDSDVYNKAGIDRRLFSKIRSDKNYHPSKETIILLAIALELSEKELDDLLESASYSLPKNNKYDLIIRFCFINKIFKLTDINELLDEYKCKLLNC